MKISNIMQKACVIIVTINMVELKSHGTVHIKNYMLRVCVKIAI
jgi:hypothetical protein